MNFREIDGIVPVLALAADELTENVFILTQHYEEINEISTKQFDEFHETLTEGIRKYPDVPIPRDLKSYLVQSEGRILMQNPLVIKKRYGFANNS